MNMKYGYTVKPPYNVIFNRTSVFEKHGFFPFYSLLKKPPYNTKTVYAILIQRDFLPVTNLFFLIKSALIQRDFLSPHYEMHEK